MDQRLAFSKTLKLAREERGVTQEELAEMATDALREAAESSDIWCDDEERSIWMTLEISRHHVQALEGFPAAPLASMELRARVLGVVLALGLDRAQVNRLAGGA